MNIEWLNEVITMIKSGIIDKAEKDGIKVYRVKNIIRVDFII